MKSGARVALGVGVGYLLGRTKKMKLALMIAGAGATGSMGELPRQLARRLGSSPELSKITESARGELLTAARSAALTAVSSRIDSLSERLQERGGGAGTDQDGEPDDEQENEYDEPDEYEQDEAVDDEDTAEDEPVRRRRAPARKAVPRRRASTRDADVEEEEGSTPSRRRTSTTRTSTRAGSGRAAVRRTRK